VWWPEIAITMDEEGGGPAKIVSFEKSFVEDERSRLEEYENINLYFDLAQWPKGGRGWCRAQGIYSLRLKSLRVYRRRILD
jgi:hypothetical protein